MQRLRLLIVLIAVMIVTACQPENPLPNAILSKDPFGEIELRYPNPWRDVSEAPLTNGSQPVTLIYSDGIPQEDLEQYPLLRLTYQNRANTELADGGNLSEYAVRTAQVTTPDVDFEPPQVIQVAQRPGVRMQGTATDGRNVGLLVIDFADVNGVVTMVLFQPERITERDQAVMARIAETIQLRITAPTVAPEATAQLSPESTGETAPDSTDEVVATPEIAPESSAETAPDKTHATEEATPAADATEEARAERGAEVTTDATEDQTPEIDVTEEATLLPERTVEPTPDVTQTAVAEATSIAARTVKIARNLSVLTPQSWSAVSNNHSYIVLNLGNNIADAVLQQQPIPSGEAMIVIEVGTSQEMFPVGSPGDLLGRLRFRMENLVEYVEPVTFGETRQIQIHNKNAVEMLVSSATDDQYIVLVEIGGNVFIQIKLLTARGELENFSPTAYEVAQSIVPG